MALARRAWQAAKAADTTLSLLDIALRVIGVSTVLSAVAGVLTWVLANPYIALVVGMAVWIAVAALLLVLMSRQSRTGAPTTAPTHQVAASEPEEGSLPFPLLRPLPSDALSRGYLSGLSFQLVDLIPPEHAIGVTKIADKVFNNCTIHGPNVVSLSNVRFDGNNTFFSEPRSAYPDAMFYGLEPSRTREWFTGTIGVRDCVFRDCTFVDVGFMVDTPLVPVLKRIVTENGEGHIP